MKTPCRKKRGEAFSKLRFPWKRGTNVETPGGDFPVARGWTEKSGELAGWEAMRRMGTIESIVAWRPKEIASRSYPIGGEGNEKED